MERSADDVPIPESDSEWRKRLTPLQFHICREKGTEQAWTGDLVRNKRHGTYRCVACGAAVFESDAKFESGTGWPSFVEPAAQDAVEESPDTSHGMRRTEVTCSRCKSHLGHVFDDGPEPTGLRYCINSAALDFEDTHTNTEDGEQA